MNYHKQSKFTYESIEQVKPLEKSMKRFMKTRRSKKNTGIAGITSTIGRNAVYGSGRAASKKFISIRINDLTIKKLN